MPEVRNSATAAVASLASARSCSGSPSGLDCQTLAQLLLRRLLGQLFDGRSLGSYPLAPPNVGSERSEELVHATAEASQRGSLAGAEEHAGKFTTAIENWSPRIPLPSLNVEFHHLLGQVFLGSVILRAAAGRRAIDSGPITADRQLIAWLRCDAGNVHRRHGWPPNHQRRQIPIGVDLNARAFEVNPPGKMTSIGPCASRTTCQLVMTIP